MENEPSKLIDIKKVIADKNPKLLKRLPRFLIRYLQKILHEDDVNGFIQNHSNDSPIDFCLAVMNKFDIKVKVNGISNIPINEGAILACNHPLGGMDAMALVTALHERRPDIKFIVNDVLMHLKNLRPIFTGVNKFGSNLNESLQRVDDEFKSNNLLCIFPAGLVSRKLKGKVRDLTWKKTFVSRAKKHDKQIIPVHIKGQLSNFFYNVYSIRKFFGIKANIEMLYLVNELFKLHDQEITITIGKPILPSVLGNDFSDQEWAEEIKNRVYEL